MYVLVLPLLLPHDAHQCSKDTLVDHTEEQHRLTAHS